MKPETKILLDEYKTEFKSYKAFLDKNDWISDVMHDSKGALYSGKLNTEFAIVDTILKSLVKFKDDVGDDMSLKVVKDFIASAVVIIKKHLSKIDTYRKNNPLNEMAEEEDFNFQTKLFSNKTKSKVALTKLNIDEDDASKKSLDLFYGNAKAPLIMREYLCKRIPDIKKKTDALGIDFSAPHINPSTSNEMLINMKAKDVPPWDPDKHFFEQPLSTIQFWEEERIKISKGINIGGYDISPWLYWHINIFKMGFGAEDDKDIKNPNFRDNEFFFDYMYNKAKQDGRKGLFMYGSRRFAKSSAMTSRLLHTMWTVNEAKGTVIGFSEKPDLVALITYANDHIQNIHPALKIPANNLTISDGIALGIKGKKNQDIYDKANLTIINLEGGVTKKGTQKPAGGTPDAFLLDEAGKAACIASWNAAKPSFAGGKNNTWRCVPLISGTAGQGELSQDAETMLKKPEMFDILPMDWDFLEQFVDPDQISWKRSNFGFFIPAQMSLEAPDKEVKPFGQFLDYGVDTKKLDLDALNKLEIHVTKWKESKEFFDLKREKLQEDLDLLAAETNSYPMDPEDCYLTSEKNVFPAMLAKNRKKFVEEMGIQGQKVWLRNNGDRVEMEQTNDPLIRDYPYKGGNFEAPIVILDDPYDQSGNKPPLGLYCAGFDDVKQATSSGDSVMSCTIFKRSYEGGEWANRIVAYYDSRPERKKDYYRNLYLLLKLFNARLLFENEDNGFLEWMEDNHMDEVYTYFSDGVGMATEENLNRNKNRKFGWSPTGLNIHNLLQTMVMYTKEESITIGEDTDLTGIDRINHPMLLEEMSKYKKDLNADRLRSFGLALKLARYYDKVNAYMKFRAKDRNEETTYKSKKKTDVKGFTYTDKLTKF